MSPAVSFAAALDGSHDPERHRWIYATSVTDGGHSLLVAHCVKECPEPWDCGCEEQDKLTQPQLAELYIQAVAADALCCGKDIESWCAQDADTILQIALYGEMIFG